MIKGATQGRGNFFSLWKIPGKITAIFCAEIHILAHSDKSEKQIDTTIAELIDKPSAGIKTILNVRYTD